MTKDQAIPKQSSDKQHFGQTSILIYAGGSCLENPGPGGWGAILRRFGGSGLIAIRSISGGNRSTTNARMKMTAIKEALGFLPVGETAPITIRTDDLSIVRGMTEWLSGWVKKGWKKAKGKPVGNRDLWEDFIRLSEGRNIKWEWVKGEPSDTKGQEVATLARSEAKKARVNRFID